MNISKLLISPENGQKLSLSSDGRFYHSDTDINLKYPVTDGVVSFLEVDDEFYEGAYKNRVRYLPKYRGVLGKLPYWLINGGFIWQVDKAFPKGSVILELGCASGVDYFGSQFEMIGLDLSKASLKGLFNYRLAVQADARKLPLADRSVDGIVSSYFWEHISPQNKDLMLQEFVRVLKPGGRMVFIYDVETDNGLLERLKARNRDQYRALFLEGDGHIGYETPDANKKRFEKAGFKVVKHFGMERTWFQSPSVWHKLTQTSGFLRLAGKIGVRLTKIPAIDRLYLALVRVIDHTVGRLFPISKSRIIITVALKQ